MRVYSFDRDGTLEPWGGPIPMDTLRRLQAQGSLVGTGGGAPAEEQRQQWVEHGVVPDFAVTKTELYTVSHPNYIHVGDDPDADRREAEKAGFVFMDAAEFAQWDEIAP